VRFGVEVEKKETLAVVLGDIAPFLSVSEADIKGALEGKWEKPCQKDFLDADATTCKIIRRKSDRKRRCFAIYLQHLPLHMIQKLRRGKLLRSQLQKLNQKLPSTIFSLTPVFTQKTTGRTEKDETAEQEITGETAEQEITGETAEQEITGETAKQEITGETAEVEITGETAEEEITGETAEVETMGETTEQETVSTQISSQETGLPRPKIKRGKCKIKGHHSILALVSLQL
jgi:hypothetical protein